MVVTLTKLQAAAMDHPAREPEDVPRVAVSRFDRKNRVLVRLAVHVGDY